MPTGYTQPLYEGTPITFEQFVLRCSRAMGAAIMQRDDSLDAEIALRRVDDYEIERLQEAITALEAAADITDEEWAAKQNAEFAEAVQSRREAEEQRAAIGGRYKAMLEQVRAWEPPTPEHEGLKDFMISQLEESLRFDASVFPLPPLEILPVDAYRATRIEELAKTVAMRADRYAAEVARVRGQNAWVLALRESLGITEGVA